MRPLEPGDPRWIGDGDRRHRVLARIGSGGMGVVYLGRSAGGRAVAIKLVHADLAGDGEFRDRFRREAAAARAVGGAFTAPVLDADPDAAVPWLVTEFLPAVPLSDAVQDGGPLPAAAVAPLAAGIAEALLAIHRAGIVHRDLKPANVLLTADGPRVIDFGIARAVDAATVTRPGVRAGSPGFMSPEQVTGGKIGPAGDVFSFGATLAFACTGAEPFGDGPWHVKMLRIESEEPRLDGIADDRLRALAASCLDRDPERRPTAAELAERLSALSRDDSPEDASWLPPHITAEIGRRAAEAENPPLPLPAPATPRKVERRVVAAATAIGLALVAGAAIVAWPAKRGPGAAATPSASAKASQIVRTTPATRTLEFYITGDVRLTSVTFTVNGQDTTLKNVKLPRRQIVRIPAAPQRSEWRLRFRFPPGQVAWRVLIDGFETSTGGSGSAGRSGTGDYDGTA
ncbi:hypothetical protein GCM10010191_52610 [Actinomadura vinacea]|uniref:Protein kinase domain-containing protein n=1 Tax=Actinomadura vinacea TaxID=115336 RepID=A0ABP5WNY0_9ACTN